MICPTIFDRNSILLIVIQISFEIWLQRVYFIQSQRLVWIPCKFLLQDKFSCIKYISIEVLIKRCNLQRFGRLRELSAFDPVEYRPRKKSGDTLSSREWTTQRMSSISFLLFSRATRIWFVRRLRCITLHLQRGIKEVPREHCLISNQR